MKNWLILILLGIPFFGYGQVLDSIPPKDEKEVGITSDEFPPAALSLISHVTGLDKVKFYTIQKPKELVYEAKFKENGRLFTSIFDSLGVLKSVLLDISLKRVEPAQTQDTIRMVLDDHFEKNKVLTTKKVFLPKGSGLEIDTVIEAVTEKRELTFCEINYLVQFSGLVGDGPVKLYEVIFDDSGKVVNATEMALHNNDNIIF